MCCEINKKFFNEIEDRIIDTIGGGAVEYAAIQEAKQCEKIVMKTYELNNNHDANLGMICGGSNDLLFVPIKREEIK